MRLYTMGYMAPGSAEEVDRLMADPRMVLVDIRLIAASRWHTRWRKGALAARYGARYLHLPGLGNVHYRQRNKGIELAAPEAPLQQLRGLLAQGHALILLCACQREASCHRRVVYDLLARGAW